MLFLQCWVIYWQGKVFDVQQKQVVFGLRGEKLEVMQGLKMVDFWFNESEKILLIILGIEL